MSDGLGFKLNQKNAEKHFLMKKHSCIWTLKLSRRWNGFEKLFENKIDRRG